MRSTCSRHHLLGDKAGSRVTVINELLLRWRLIGGTAGIHVIRRSDSFIGEPPPLTSTSSASNGAIDAGASVQPPVELRFIYEL